jgi:cysteine desulfurase
MIYLDHAATTYITKEVADLMHTILLNTFGNPSSTHKTGQNAKAILEESRKSIAKQLGVLASEIIFTSSGTESINWILINAVENLNVKRFITTKIEHHAVLNTLEHLQKKHGVEVIYLTLDENGFINLSELNEKLNSQSKTMVTLMHINNEIGTILPLKQISEICKQNQTLFHSDMVQSIGKNKIDLNETEIDFIAASAHKFHGPKGVGFLYASKKHTLKSWLLGGAQEKGLRAGTEAVHQIAGMSKALEIELQNLESNQQKINKLRNYTCKKLNSHFNHPKIFGDYENSHIINVILPFNVQKASMLTFNLNLKGIAVSRGSACQSGSVKPSHVLKTILSDSEKQLPNLRISLATNNTFSEIDTLIDVLKTI